MKQQEITTLKIIESLEKDPNQTQRDLAKELNISLGLVNSFTKRLIQKGYFKIKTIPRKRIKYILTPDGMYEKTRLTYQYIMYSLEFYKDVRIKIKSIYDGLFKQGFKRVFFVGACELTEIALITLQESKLELANVVDDNKVGKKIIGCVVMHCSVLKDITPKDIVIVNKTNDEKEYLEITEKLKKMNVRMINLASE